jgi:glutamyl endopeptidase
MGLPEQRYLIEIKEETITMRTAHPQRRNRSIFALMSFLLVAAMFALGVSPSFAQANAEGAGDPNAITSSDGSKPAASNADVVEAGGTQYVASSRGSGAGSPMTVNDKEIAAARVPNQSAIETVIPPDGRFRIFGTTSYPYRAIAHITSSIGGCTGWLINRNTVVTAGHCLHNGRWATNVRVYPGRNGSSAPYGFCTARRLYSVVGWTVSRNRDYDYGAIKLNCTVGTRTGWFGFRWQSASLTGQPSYISGYPGDKPFGTQWRHNDRVRITQTRRLYYANDTFGGMSGSPVWNGNAGCNPCGIAIHAYGLDGTGFNGGTRITQAVFNNLVAWRNAP